MAAPYIAEVQIARWTSDNLHQSFKDLGFQVREWPVTPHLEKQVPADMLFFSPEFSKLFGLQYKALYHNGEDFWPLDFDQHKTIRTQRWISYCCSEIRDPVDHGLALYFARFYRASFRHQPRLASRWFVPEARFYTRWGAFYSGLKKCSIGVKVSSPDDVRSLMASVTGEARSREISQLSEFLLADFDQRVLWSQRTF